jgi:hypothetical protein
MYAYISPPAMVRLSKPAHSREGAFIQRRVEVTMTLEVVERTFAYKPEITSMGT